MVGALQHTDLEAPGITRRRRGKGWCFVSPDGSVIRCARARERLLRIALPPAYSDAWYNPDPNGHIQAVGTDARGRRQYRYHLDYRASQEAGKFEFLSRFGAALPAIRTAVATGQAKRSLDKERVVTAVVRLLDIGHLRVGNSVYARENGSFGATTLRNRHIRVEGGRIMLRFRQKGGLPRRVELTDRALATTIRRCQELPGQQLFGFEDADGDICPIRSDDVNAWLRDVSGLPVTAKQFRTWWASVLALDGWRSQGMALGEALKVVAAELGNTPAVVRKSYVHPAVIAIIKGEMAAPERPAGSRALEPEERWLMAVLRKA